MLSFDFQRLTGSENFHCPLVCSLFTIDQSSINPLNCYSYIKGLSNKTFPSAETMLEEAIWTLDIAPFALKRIGKLTWQIPKSFNPPKGKNSNIQNS